MVSGTTLKLNTGSSIPALGFGTWQDADEQAAAVETALKVGYRHIDTAIVYGTEPAVAKGIKASGVSRSEVFITTKLWNNAHHPDDVEKQLDTSLKNLDVDYVDLYLMHWPVAWKRGDEKFPRDSNGKLITEDIDYLDTYRAMEKVYHSGKARAIGVSNFSQAEMERLLKEASVPPAAHQYENHPYLAQHDFFAWHEKHGIHVTQYSPFGNSNPTYDKGKNIPKLIEDPVLVEIGKKYGGKSGAQVALAWGITKGRTVIPKSKTPSRIKDNFEGDFKLEAEDVKKIDGLDRKLRLNDPSGNFGYKFFKDLDGAAWAGGRKGDHSTGYRS